MNKIIGGVLGVMLALTPFAFANHATAATSWDVTGSYDVSFEYLGSNYVHDMDLAQDPADSLTGSGGHPANGTHVYTWVLTSGSVTGNNISFTANYTATADAVVPQTVMTVTGVIDTNGTMSGTWSDNYQGGSRSGTWETTSGAAVQVNKVIVRPSDAQGWTSTGPYADTRTGGIVDFVSDVTSPLPTAALHLTTDSTNEAKAQYMTINHAGTLLSSVTNLSFATRKISGPAHADASYQLGIDLDGDINTNDRTTLVYEPYWNGTVTSDWQEWDVDNGQFWSSKTVGGFVAGFGGAPFYTLAGVKASYPNAIVTVVGVNVGSYNPDFNVEADAFRFNGVVYDFELDLPDIDDDGILNGEDLCPATTADNFTSFGHANGRYSFDGTTWESTEKGSKKFMPTIEMTHGCSGTQILVLMGVEPGSGQYKFGITKGTIEEWLESLSL
jgi:hypothetical protein